MKITERRLRKIIRSVILTESAMSQFRLPGFFLIRRKEGRSLSQKLDLTKELGIDQIDMNILDKYAVDQLEVLDNDDSFNGMEYEKSEGTHIIREKGSIYAATPYSIYAVMDDTIRQSSLSAKRRNYNKLESAPVLLYAREYHNKLGNISLKR